LRLRLKNGIESVFATPIYFAMIDNVDNVKKEYEEIKESLNFFDTPDMWGRPQKLTTQSFEDNIIDNRNMKIVGKTIDHHLQIFLEALNLPRKKYRWTSWITANSKGEYAPVHNHLNADISGVYYYQTNQKDGSIFFLTPTLAMTNSIFTKFSDNVYVKPEEGKLLMFPGWLQHGVTTNTTDSIRSSLAFNVYFEK
jgi:uncharacterized protein (TIGR02466 family)